MTLPDTPGHGLDPKAVRARVRKLAKMSKIWREVAEVGDSGTEPLPQALDALDEVLAYAKRLASPSVGSDTAGLPADHAGLVSWLGYREKVKIQEATEADPGHPNENALKEAERYRAAREAIAALSRAPEAKPVAWRWCWKSGQGREEGWAYREDRPKETDKTVTQPLYANHPAPQLAIALVEELTGALQNASGLMDTPIGRRRHDGDPFYAEAIESIRRALASAKRFKEGA